MKPKSGVVRNKRIIVLYTEDEFNRIKMLFAKSVCQTMASYVRKVSLGDPVEICIRNQSFDDFVEELIPLRKEMATALKEAAAEPGLERIIRVQEDIKVIMNKILALCMSP